MHPVGGRRRLLGGLLAAAVLASGLAVVAVVGGVDVAGVVPFGTSSDHASSEPMAEDPAAIAAVVTAEVVAEIERAGRQLDPVGLSPVATEVSSADVRSDGPPGFPSVRSDASGEFGIEGVGGSAWLWPEWVTCEFDDDRTSDPGVRSVVVDRDRQRSWFCDGTEVVRVFPITTARNQPDPGVYEVYAKDMHTSSTFGGGYSTMTHFVAFTYGKFQGARVAFHSVPVYRDGSWVQPLESVGDLARHGDSSGCIRALPDDAEAIWDWLAVGDLVRVTT